MPQIHDGGDGNTAPFVSFLTTAYQTERYVSETIESVLAQTRGDWELIVVDNGNSDEMARIISNYTSDPRITHDPAGQQGLRRRGQCSGRCRRGALLVCIWTATTPCNPTTASVSAR